MSNRIKPIPKTPTQISQEPIVPYLSELGKPPSPKSSRGTDYSMKGDTVKDISIGLEDIDEAIMYYFKNIIKPNIIQNNNQLSVPVIYGSPERWKSVQADGFYRDANGKLMVPLIMFKRESIEKNRTLGNKLDGNLAHLYQVVGTKYNNRNAYDKFNIINNRIPSEQYYITATPDYITLTYNCVIFTDYVEQNNKLVEAIEFASDSYWGDPSRFKFRANIDSFSTTTILENGTDRAAKSTFTVKVNGYIIPNTVNKDLATVRSKFYTKSQIVFDLETIDTNGIVTNVDKLRFANKPLPQNTMAATSFVGGGNNITNNITYITSGSSSSGSANPLDLQYLNLNNTATSSITTVNTVTFENKTIFYPPSGSSIPTTTKNSFSLYRNGQYIGQEYITSINQVSTNIVATVSTSSLGYVLESNDMLELIGKIEESL